MNSSDKAFVLGLDGVPWSLLDGWIDAGKLPNFRRIREEGAAGPLESTTPATTALAWPSISTGTWPDKHDVYGFQRLGEDYTHRMSTRRDVARPELWDVLSPAVVGNVPMTYPADESIDGAMVTGMMTPAKNDRFAHPPALRSAIRELLPEYEFGLEWESYEDRRDFLPDLDRLLQTRRKLMRLLLDEYGDWRLFYFVYTAPDRLQHLFWEEGILLDHYRELDDILGEVLDAVEAVGATLFVVSDHGFGPVEKYVAVNRVLEEAGLLVRERSEGTRGALAELGITKDRVLSVLERVGVDSETIVHTFPRPLVDRIAASVPGSHGLYDVDFSETAAFVHGSGCVYVNDVGRFERGIVDLGSVDAVKRDVRRTFESVTDPKTGERVLEVHDGSELFPTDPTSPDFIVEAIDGYLEATGLADRVIRDSGSTAASHRSEGIFFAWGPDVDPGATAREATVVDVAPTVLHAVDEPVPEDADGDVLGIFAEGTAPGRRAARYEEYAEEAGGREGDEDFEDVESRLRGLGYLE